VALAGVNAVVLPSLSIEAPPIGAATVPVKGGQEPVRNAMLRCTQPFNLSGHPAISVPCGTTTSGLPVGLQIVGHAGRTNDLLRVARAIERTVHRQG
jgi:Asp-tRNA(Asn)/Glu-tRNA(Gln) amidotransferase A subunit family amidase